MSNENDLELNLPPEDQNYDHDPDHEADNLPEDEEPNDLPAPKKSLNVKRLGMVGAGVIALGAGGTIIPSYFSSSPPPAVHTSSPRAHRASFGKPAITANSASQPLPDPDVAQRSGIDGADSAGSREQNRENKDGFQRPLQDTQQASNTNPLQAPPLQTSPLQTPPLQSSGLQGPPDVIPSIPDADGLRGAASEKTSPQSQTTPQRGGGSFATAGDATAAPGGASLTDILNALHDNNDTLAKHLDGAAETISQHIDNKSDAVISKIDAMQSTINALNEKTNAMSKTLTDMEEHGLQRPVDDHGASGAAHRVTVKRRHYRMTVTTPEKREAKPDLSAYHLRGVSKKMVIIQGPNGYMTVPIGSTANQTVGIVQGIERRGDQWVVSTSNGIIQE